MRRALPATRARRMCESARRRASARRVPESRGRRVGHDADRVYYCRFVTVLGSARGASRRGAGDREAGVPRTVQRSKVESRGTDYSTVRHSTALPLCSMSMYSVVQGTVYGLASTQIVSQITCDRCSMLSPRPLRRVLFYVPTLRVRRDASHATREHGRPS